MEQLYWDNYYKSKGGINNPSGFAKYVNANYSKSKYGKIIDIGCGNGRDTIFLAESNIQVIGVDQSKIIIQKNIDKCKEINNDVHFQVGDFSTINYDELAHEDFTIFSRFTLHAINYEEEDKLFSNLANAKYLKYILIEARSINDDLYGIGKQVGKHEFCTSHYRRFIDPEELKIKIEKNFKIESIVESKGLSKVKKEDPCLVRVIAKLI